MKIGKRILGLALCLSLTLSLLPSTALAAERAETAPAETLDVTPAVEAPAVTDEEAPAQSGIPRAETLASGDTYSRGQWMESLVTVFSLTAETYPDLYFPDITPESPWYDAVMVATMHGLAEVEAGDNFEPDGVLTRDVAVHSLNFLLGIQPGSETYSFSDSASVSYPADAQVAVENNWLALSDGKFLPQQAVTQTEAAGMLEAAEAVLADRDVSQPSANYKFAQDVKEIPNSAAVNSSLDIDTGVTTLLISGYTGTLAAGDTIVFYEDDFAFVYGVAEVSQSSGVWTVVTCEAPDSAIEQFECVGETSPVLEPYIPEDSGPVTLMTADGDEVTFGALMLESAKKHELSYSRKFESIEGLSGKLTAKVENITLEKKFVGNEKYFKLNGDITVSSTMELDLLNDDVAARLTLAGVTLGSFGSLGLEINLKAAASIAYEYSADFSIGVSYQNSQFAMIHEMRKPDTCISAKGTVSARLSLAAHLDFGKAASASASLGIGPVLEGKVKTYSSGTPKTCTNLAGYLYAGVEIEAKLAKFKYKGTWEFYGEKNSPIRVVEHIEDGVSVGSCTRGNDPGTAQSGYSAPKYVTPASSRYYASATGAATSSTSGGSGGTAASVVIWNTSDNEDGTVTVTGYQGSASILNIPQTIDGKTVTMIGSGAFQNNKTIRMALIPDTVTSIGSSAFNGCSNLAMVEISNSVITIGDGAFLRCTNLTTIEFGNGITELGTSAFSGCKALEEVVLPENLVTIGFDCFDGCNALKSVYIPATLNEMKKYTSWSSKNGPFADCDSLDQIIFDDVCKKFQTVCLWDALV